MKKSDLAATSPLGMTSDPAATSWEREALQAVRELQFGSVEIVVHEGRVVQIEKKEKVRFDEAGRRRLGPRGRE
jgi:hypothetical protein